jgi:hypothetical protein
VSAPYTFYAAFLSIERTSIGAFLDTHLSIRAVLVVDTVRVIAILLSVAVIVFTVNTLPACLVWREDMLHTAALLNALIFQTVWVVAV